MPREISFALSILFSLFTVFSYEMAIATFGLGTDMGGIGKSIMTALIGLAGTAINFVIAFFLLGKT